MATDTNETKVIHQTINGKYRLQLERSAVKGVDGFKCEVNSDSLEECKSEAQKLYDYAIGLTKPDSKIGETPEVKG